jgi:hypothetical protein
MATKGKKPPKSVSAVMETRIFVIEEINTWRLPIFQRALKMNAKFHETIEGIKESGGVIPGVLTLGTLPGDKALYIVDGQHRVEAFKQSGLSECIVDVRRISFDGVAEMAEQFAGLNSRIANMRPDDILRAMEHSTPALLKIRTACDFVGYGQVRRGGAGGATVSMATLLKNWVCSRGETPAANAGGMTGAKIAETMDSIDCDQLIVFMQTARAAWGADPENYRLWGSLNLTLSMWLWRQLVLDKARASKRAVTLNPDLFRKCLMAVSGDSGFIDWLLGRGMTERDRSPCYQRLKAIFVKRLQQETGRKAIMPGPSWSSR